MVNDSQSAGRPVSGGPLFCARRFFTLCASLCLAAGLSACLYERHQTPAYGYASERVAKSSHHHGHECATTTQSGESASSEQVSIDSVTDGDTVVLSDRRKVRIIGINSAELSKTSERALKADALAARDLISQLVAETDYVTLVPGDEPKDRYGRVLAHLLLPNGRSIATELLARGLAAATAVGPNTRCAEHNHRIERAARGQSKGLWQHRDNPWFANNIGTNSIQGFHILSTRVESIQQKRNSWHIELANDVLVYAKRDLIEEQAVQSWVGKRVEVRGWFGRRDGRVSVNLHHPSNLVLQ